MSISGISSLYGSSGIFSDTAQPRTGAVSFNKNQQADSVSISSQAREMYAAMQGSGQDKRVEDSSFGSQAISNTQQNSTGEAVIKWYNGFISGKDTSVKYSEWLPENYAKYNEMLESGNLGQNPSTRYAATVFAALGAEKIVTEQDLLEGTKALDEHFGSISNPTTIEELNSRIKQLPSKVEIAQSQQKHAQEIAKAEEMLALWEEDNRTE